MKIFVVGKTYDSYGVVEQLGLKGNSSGSKPPVVGRDIFH